MMPTVDRKRTCSDFEAYLTRLRSRVIREVHQQLRQLNSIKVQVKIVAEYQKPPVVQQSGGALERARRAAKRRKHEEKEKDKNVATIGLTTKLTPITDRANVRPTIERLLAELRERHINAIQLGSGFMLRAILSADLSISKHTPLAGGSYIPLPDLLQRKHCVVNVQNKDNRFSDMQCWPHCCTPSIANIQKEHRTTILLHTARTRQPQLSCEN